MHSVTKAPAAYEDGSGAIGWVNPTYAYAEDGAVAQLTLPGGYSVNPNLRLLDFGFRLPAGALVAGVKVEVKHCQSVAVATNVQLVVNGMTGDEKSLGEAPAALAWQQAGGAAAKWGVALTAEQVNGFGFGLAYILGPTNKVSVVQVDAARMTVYYMLPGELGIRSTRSLARRLEVTRMYEHQNPVVVADVVTTGQSTKDKEVLAAVAGKIHRVQVELISLGAAGHIVFKRGATAVTPKILFPAAGTQFLGVELEGAAGEAINMTATLDAAAAANVPMECSVRSIVK